MRLRTVVGSCVAHVVVVGLALTIRAQQPARSATFVEIHDSARPPPPPPAARPPRPPRPPRAAAPAATTTTTTAAAAPVFVSGLLLGNADGPGLAIDVAVVAPRAAPVRRAESARAPVLARADVCRDKPTQPRPIERRRAIAYSERARVDGAAGRLLLRVNVDAVGAVGSVEVLEPVHPELDRQAVDAVSSWRFEPARRCGVAEAGTWLLATRFEVTG